MHRERRNLALREPSKLVGLVGDPRVAPNQLAGGADAKFLSDFSVVVREDVLGIGVDTDDIERANVVAGLLLHLSNDGFRDGLSASPRVTSWIGSYLVQSAVQVVSFHRGPRGAVSSCSSVPPALCSSSSGRWRRW